MSNTATKSNSTLAEKTNDVTSRFSAALIVYSIYLVISCPSFGR